MDAETVIYLALVVAGLLVIIGVMIFFINPPEAWIKRVFRPRGKH